MKKTHFETDAVRTQTARTQYKEHSTPLYLTSGFVFDDSEEMRASFAEEKQRDLYSRYSNPNTSEFIDKDNPDNVDFIQRFNDTYETMPSDFSYLGYDVASYYLNLLQVSGANFEIMLPTEKMQGLSRKFHFVKTGIESGFENHSTYIVRYQDYELVKVH